MVIFSAFVCQARNEYQKKNELRAEKSPVSDHTDGTQDPRDNGGRRFKPTCPRRKKQTNDKKKPGNGMQQGRSDKMTAGKHAHTLGSVEIALWQALIELFFRLRKTDQFTNPPSELKKCDEVPNLSLSLQLVRAHNTS
jgi:hypothetical protein